MKQCYILLVGIFMLLRLPLSAQDSLHLRSTEKYLRTVSGKSQHAASRLHAESVVKLDRYISRLEKLEKKVAMVHPQTAQHVFPPLLTRARTFRVQLEKAGSVPTQYFGYLDTLQGTVGYIGKKAGGLNSSYEKAKTSVAALQGEVALTEQTMAIIEAGKRELESILQPLGSFTGELSLLHTELYDYLTQVNACKAMLSDTKKIEQKVLSLLGNSKVFQSFMSLNSLFAGMLGLPADYNSTRTLEDLQTRALVDPALQARLGADPSLASGQMDVARSQFERYRSRYASMEHAGQAPSGKSNELRSMTFRRRLQPGGNIRFQRATLYFPTTMEITAQLGYQFHKKGTAGIGINYLLGLGRGWDHIVLSHQGVGLCGFLDWKLRGNLFVTGGAEMNRLSGLHRFRELYNWKGYQLSALLGIKKKVQLKGNKQATTSIEYDFLSSRTLSRPVRIRFGYNFK